MLISDLRRIGDKMKLVRTQAGLSQEETAWQAGLSLRAYADIERGLVNPRLKSILNICEVFHITPDMIMTDEENPASLNYEDIILEVDMLSPRDKYVAYKILDTYYNAIIANEKNTESSEPEKPKQ